MAGEPLVSTVIAVHDGERYLAEAIESVLAQSHRSVELVVVDDGSRDSSGDIARSFQPDVRVVRQQHAGVGVARNRGVAACSGAFVAFLDADDVWDPRKLERQLELLVASPGAGLAFGAAVEFYSPELADAEVANLRRHERPRPSRVAGAMLARRAAFDQVGPFEPGWRMGDFLEWLLRAQQAGVGETMLGEVVLRRRIHPWSHSVRSRTAIGDYARILKQALDARREQAR